jgi:pimeloyl-ACP methyl ester carboxylesterase
MYGRRAWWMTSCLAAVAALAGEPQRVSFQAADGVRIAADYLAPRSAQRGGAPIVILLHMYRSDRTAYAPLIAPLHEAGFAVLAIDLRGHGESATTETRDAVLRRDPAIFRKMQDDVRGAYDWLAQQPSVDRARFALVGASVGTSVALQYAAKDRSVDAIVGLSPGLNDMGLDSAGELHQITGRKILLLATEDERDAPYTLQKQAVDVQVRIDQDHQAHGTDLFGVVPGIEREIVRFLKAGVGEPTATTVYGSIKRNIYHEASSGWLKEIAPTNLRYYSSPQEAESRGLRAAKSKGPPNGPTREK